MEYECCVDINAHIWCQNYELMMGWIEVKDPSEVLAFVDLPEKAWGTNLMQHVLKLPRPLDMEDNVICGAGVCEMEHLSLIAGFHYLAV